MGFVLRSAFWLGLVYYAMPLGHPPLGDPMRQSDFSSRAGSKPEALLCNSANGAVAGHLGPLGPAYRNATAIGCAATIASNLTAPANPALDATAPNGAPSRQASAQSLSDRDKLPPWIAPRSAPRAPLPGPGRASQGGRSRVIKRGRASARGHALTTIETIRDDFAFLDDWEDRYRYVIELGRALEPLDAEAHNEANRVRGCVSQVWIELDTRTDAHGGTILHFRGDSDSHLVKGLIAIALALYSDRTPREILAQDAMAAFRELGLEQHLTPQRSNGVRSMIERIRADALAVA